jgi:hypothetical protein
LKKQTNISLFYLEYLEQSTKEERLALTQMAQNKIEQKTRAATERVAMGLDRFTKKMLSENRYMHQEVFVFSIFFINYYNLFLKIYMREQELVELEQYVRALEQVNLEINEKLNAAHIADATTFT